METASDNAQTRTASARPTRREWLQRALGHEVAEPLPASADASFRSYWRVNVDGESLVLMDAPPDREDIRPWLDVAKRLAAAGLHAPAIRADDAEHGYVLMSDLGSQTLLPAMDADNVDRWYGQAMEAILRMQRDVAVNDLPHYDEQRLMDELELMPRWFLGEHLGFTPSCEQWDIVENAHRALINAALSQPKAFVHRDFHSRNLMIDGGDLGIIDFQDAVRGPVTYDLVSLLRDCYIEWPEDRVYDWVDAYREQAISAGLFDADPERFRRWFDLMGLQRHIKVLGIFCRLWYRDGKAGYLNDLPLVWRYTRTVGRRYPEVASLIELIEDVLGDRDITQPRVAAA
ncbi:MAG: phosphotransferase [Lysobacteraceae bacterium]